METLTVEYTAQEADVQLKLIDLACRHGGLEVAEAAAVLARKLRDAAKAAQAKQSEGEKPNE